MDKVNILKSLSLVADSLEQKRMLKHASIIHNIFLKIAQEDNEFPKMGRPISQIEWGGKQHKYTVNDYLAGKPIPKSLVDHVWNNIYNDDDWILKRKYLENGDIDFEDIVEEYLKNRANDGLAWVLKTEDHESDGNIKNYNNYLPKKKY